jgi:hypothetical protein
MKIYLPLLAVLLLHSCASSTKIVASWGQSDTEPKKYNKVAVVAISHDTQTRASVETVVAEKMNAAGIKAVPTFNTFPFAGVIGELGLDHATVQHKIKERINENGMDAVLTITLLDKTKEEHYVEGSSISLAAPVYGYPYYGYYSYAYSTVYSSGYYTTSTTYFIESMLYDVASEKLIWTAQTTTMDPSSIEKEAANYATLIVHDMLAKKVVAK